MMESDDVESYQLHNLSHASLTDVGYTFPVRIQGNEKLKTEYSLLEKTTNAATVSIRRIRIFCVFLTTLVCILGAGSGYVTYRLMLKIGRHEDQIESLRSELNTRYDPSMRHNGLDIQANQESVTELSNQITSLNETFREFKDRSQKHIHETESELNAANRDLANKLDETNTWIRRTYMKTDWLIDSFLSITETSEMSYEELSSSLKSGDDTIFIYERPVHPNDASLNSSGERSQEQANISAEQTDSAMNISEKLSSSLVNSLSHLNTLQMDAADELHKMPNYSRDNLNISLLNSSDKISILPKISFNKVNTSQAKLDEELETMTVNSSWEPVIPDDTLNASQLFTEYKPSVLPLDSSSELKPNDMLNVLPTIPSAELNEELPVKSSEELSTLPFYSNDELNAHQVNSSDKSNDLQFNTLEGSSALLGNSSNELNTTQINANNELKNIPINSGDKLNAFLFNSSNEISSLSSMLKDYNTVNSSELTTIPMTKTSMHKISPLHGVSKYNQKSFVTASSYKLTVLGNTTTFRQSRFPMNLSGNVTTWHKTSSGDRNTRPPISSLHLVNGIWADWSLWSKCSISCGSGQMHRVRACSSSHTGTERSYCGGEHRETRLCRTISCPVHGGWSTWAKWSLCSSSCGPGIRHRARMCNNPSPSVLGRTCIGDLSQYEACSDMLCPVDGRWSTWSMWSSCSVTCGVGEATRLRSCSNPSPSNDGKNCSGSTAENKPCSTINCPVHGGWNTWDRWSPCSSSCGNGLRMRVRTCTDPEPSSLGNMCKGESAIYEECNSKTCAVDGEWSPWSVWSSCSVSCGHGIITRSRTCSAPSPANEGKSCTGQATEEKTCETFECPVDGKWSVWESWSLCSSSCGPGIRYRGRTCNNPSPSILGRMCSGEPSQYEACSNTTCSEHGGWSEWGKWSTCSNSCGYGMKRRFRGCSSPKPNLFGDACEGDSSDYELCTMSACPVDGQWTAWSVWSGCSVTLGRGQMTRLRSCSNPSAANGGLNCSGSNEEHQPCNFACPVHGQWSTWGSWSSCEPSGNTFCGGGTKQRRRTCTNPSPSSCGLFCEGLPTQNSTCTTYSDIKLIGGPTENIGTIQLCYQGRLGTVCDDAFEDADATVVCRMLGYKSGVQHQSARYGQGSGGILLDDLGCNSYESTIFSCSHPGIGEDNCSHGEDAGVTCS